MNLSDIWKEFQSYDGTGSEHLELPGCGVQFYKGAMEIPLVAFVPEQAFDLSPAKVADFSKALSSLGLTLDVVQDGGNYKINKSEDGQYVGRITSQALKLHAERIKEMGWDAFNRIAGFFLEPADAVR